MPPQVVVTPDSDLPFVVSTSQVVKSLIGKEHQQPFTGNGYLLRDLFDSSFSYGCPKFINGFEAGMFESANLVLVDAP